MPEKAHLVLSTPRVSLPQCSSPAAQKSRSRSRRSPALMSQCRCSLICGDANTFSEAVFGSTKYRMKGLLMATIPENYNACSLSGNPARQASRPPGATSIRTTA